MTTVWLTGVTTDYVDEAARTDLHGQLGLLIQPGTTCYVQKIPDFQVKRWINDLTGSMLVEEKSYEEY